MALTPFPSSVGRDEIQTHDLSIINLVCYPQDQTFALFFLQPRDRLGFWKILHNHQNATNLSTE